MFPGHPPPLRLAGWPCSWVCTSGLPLFCPHSPWPSVFWTITACFSSGPSNLAPTPNPSSGRWSQPGICRCPTAWRSVNNHCVRLLCCSPGPLDTAPSACPPPPACCTSAPGSCLSSPSRVPSWPSHPCARPLPCNCVLPSPDFPSRTSPRRVTFMPVLHRTFSLVTLSARNEAGMSYRAR